MKQNLEIFSVFEIKLVWELVLLNLRGREILDIKSIILILRGPNIIILLVNNLGKL